MYSDISIVPIAVMIISAGFFFFVASLASVLAEPFLKDEALGGVEKI